MVDEAQIRQIVRKITERVLERLMAQGLFLPEQNGALVVIPNFLPESALLFAYLKQQFPNGVACAVLEPSVQLDSAFERIDATTREAQQHVLSSLKFYHRVVLAMPTLQLLGRISNGEDAGFAEQLMLRAILLEKKVSVVLDYTPPKFKRGTFFEGLVGSITALQDMGVEMVSLTPQLKPAETGFELVTEQEVLAAYQYGDRFVKCAKGALVTPLARDKANELGVSIQE
jgi:hypothetical protein